MKLTIVIPARMDSTRFPGKPLADLCGKPMIQWVYEAAVRSGIADRILIATPDNVIFDAAKRFAGDCVLTSLHHPSGTDRLVEVAETIDSDIFINVQGDEPLIQIDTIRACASVFEKIPEAEVSSVWSPCDDTEFENPAVVKVVVSQLGTALYFSRSPIPYFRSHTGYPVRKHVGIYGFRKPALDKFKEWGSSPLELTEGLEQLRFLDHGIPIYMAEGIASELAVDTPEQAESVRKILAARLASEV